MTRRNLLVRKALQVKRNSIYFEGKSGKGLVSIPNKINFKERVARLNEVIRQREAQIQGLYQENNVFREREDEFQELREDFLRIQRGAGKVRESNAEVSTFW